MQESGLSKASQSDDVEKISVEWDISLLEIRNKLIDQNHQYSLIDRPTLSNSMQESGLSKAFQSDDIEKMYMELEAMYLGGQDLPPASVCCQWRSSDGQTDSAKIGSLIRWNPPGSLFALFVCLLVGFCLFDCFCLFTGLFGSVIWWDPPGSLLACTQLGHKRTVFLGRALGIWLESFYWSARWRGLLWHDSIGIGLFA